MAEAVNAAKDAANATKVGDPSAKGNHLGPVVSKVQFEKIQRLVKQGIEGGADLVAGGPGRPDGFAKGYFVRPTVFAQVRNDMTIAREEIFGPVLCIIPYENEDDAVRIANDTAYGLSGFVTSGASNAPAAWPNESGPGMCTSTAHGSISGDVSVATNGRATAGSGGKPVSKNFLN
jgi:aldehyde dehydrogenase (NAD+)